MRVPSLILAAAGAALIAPAALPAPATAVPPRERPAGRGEGHAGRGEGMVTAADLLARTGTCTELSRGRYRTDADSPATVPVCGTDDAVFWKADLDVDCDGRPTTHCNSATDPVFAPTTAFQQSDGLYLNAETLPYIVVPAPSSRWDYRAHGIRGGSVAAVVHGDRVRYAVVGDTGPSDLIGEASYATAEGLGIDPDPLTGGAASDVTYILFRNSLISPIEDHEAAVATGERLARQFLTTD
ncbi:glycoside hydrolase family 75 protein [Streptomyces flaveolus]|uniref:glycoside hydrolase family 75 protein n=1 Tax=Streptomyces flaveolus TaxID=67297 RepID=UPI0033A5B8C9